MKLTVENLNHLVASGAPDGPITELVAFFESAPHILESSIESGWNSDETQEQVTGAVKSIPVSVGVWPNY